MTLVEENLLGLALGPTSRALVCLCPCLFRNGRFSAIVSSGSSFPPPSLQCFQF